jgi:hypothetical protein
MVYLNIISQLENLLGIGEYDNGIPTGTWYSFGDYGHLMGIPKDFSKNTYPTPAEHHSIGTCSYKCYYIGFHPNGVKKEEGVLLWEGHPLSDTTFEYGLWKYYDEAGLLIKIREFK